VALNIKNREVERLAGEVAGLANETKTEAIRRALAERKERLQLGRFQQSKRERLEAWLRTEVWPQIPAQVRGRPLSKEEEEEILGFGPDGF
jgi:antitoxin VapB